MAKKRPPKKQILSIQGFDSEHLRQTNEYMKMIDAIYNNAVADFAKLSDRLKINLDNPFSFKDYPTAKNKANEIIAELSNNLKVVITEGSRKQWLYANEKNDAFLDSIFDTTKIKKTTLAKYQDRNLEALKTFQTRKENGLNLSERIFNYSGQMKTQMEMAIDLAIGDGISAQSLSKELKQYLVDPDKLFRRVRDKHGVLQLSKNAQAFNPGQGKYRSSHKNAMRLARTEINMAYRESDHLRWKSLDFVTGFEVRLSNAHKIYDICDILKGNYPKNFKFIGWHPQCMCQAIPILLSPDEFDKDELSELRSAINGTEYKPFQSPNTITEMPKGFKDWVTENAERSQGWKSQPYWIKDNFSGGKIGKGIENLKINENNVRNSLRNQNSNVSLLKKSKEKENMTTAQYLTENRDKVIATIKTQISSRSTITLKDAMLVFKNKMEETNNNTTLSYAAVKEASNNNFVSGNTATSFTKPFSESNAAKQNAYFGADKAKKFRNNL